MTTAQLDAVNSGIKTDTVMVSISASLNNDGTAYYVTYNNWTLDRQDTGNAFLCLVTSEFKMTYDKTYFSAKNVSSKWNHGSLNGLDFASSPNYTTLTPGIYIVKLSSTDVYREFYSLDYLLNKILSIS